MKAKGTFSITKWDENTLEQLTETTKTTKATVLTSLTGEIEGNASTEYLMFYRSFDTSDPHKASAVYLGLMVIKGSINGKHGSFAVEDHGTFENGAAASSLHIISGSGTGELKNISGKGSYTADGSGAVTEFEYEL